jgi:glycosyltransferase involved in cell wall biosynthesis
VAGGEALPGIHARFSEDGPGTDRRSEERQAPRVSVVIPTLNEARNLAHVFTRLPADIFEVVLVDGYSRDNTVEVARALYRDVRIVSQMRPGKGNALVCGFAACSGDIIVMLDADGSADPREIPRFVDALLAGADFAKGSRFLSGGGSADITRFRSFGNWTLNALVNVLYRTSYSDLCYGYNAFWTRCLPYMHVDCDGFEVETLINVRIAKARLQVVEVPSYEASRVHGVSNLHAFRDGWRVLKTIVLERFTAVQVAEVSQEPNEKQESWNGEDRRSNQERRSGVDRRKGPRISLGRRSGYGRRSTDPRPTTALSTRQLLQQGMSV